MSALIMTNENSTGNDDALRAKVDEAMNVYNEYLKNRGEGTDESMAANGGDSGAAGAESGEQNA